ncbi:MAG: hypothetical protein ACRC8S_03620 [Fimbriiglobus sp.]
MNRNDLNSHEMTMTAGVNTLAVLAFRVEAVGGYQGTPDSLLSQGFIPEPPPLTEDTTPTTDPTTGRIVGEDQSRCDSGSPAPRWSLRPSPRDARALRGESSPLNLVRDYLSHQSIARSSTRMCLQSISAKRRIHDITTLAAW